MAGSREQAFIQGTPLNCEQEFRRSLFRAVFALTCLSSAAMPACAQDSTKPAMEKWRPKDGTYAEAGKNFESRCGEFGDVTVELAEQSISGSEWGCKITKLTDTAPGAIRLNMTCNDYNLAQNINEHDPNPYDREFKEIMLLRKINEKTLVVRKTENGRFTAPRWQAFYCSEAAQRMYTEAKAKSKAEAELETQQKAAKELSRHKP